MKKLLLFALALASASSLSFADDETGTKTANGTTPPQPEAPYYVDFNGDNTYYGMYFVEGSDPAMYEVKIPVTTSNFKIYAKEFWTLSESSGYNQNNYIWGSGDNTSGITQGQYKSLSQPGTNDMQIENGGTWYNCLYQFWPTGHNGNGKPELLVTQGTQEKPEEEAPTIDNLYIIGDFTSGNFNLSDARQGELFSNYQPESPDASYIYVFRMVPLANTYRFRFTNMYTDNWIDLETQGVQFYPEADTQYCANYWDSTDVTNGNWYTSEYTTGAVNQAWAPSSAMTKSSGSDGVHYDIFFNTKTLKAAVGWGINTGVEKVPDSILSEKPVNVYDMMGRLIKTNVIPSEARQNLPQGLYIIGNKKVAVM